MKTFYITDTPGFKKLTHNARMRNSNRKASEELDEQLDPDGVHVLMFHMLHNDCEWRTVWLVKVIGTDQPAEVTLDLDLDQLKHCIWSHQPGDTNEQTSVHHPATFEN